MTTTFVVPPDENIREVYTAEMVKDTTSAWPKGTVVVRKNGEELCNYKRNYSMMGTFEPFRQLRDGVWRDYALISSQYTFLSVLDLATGEVIAEEQPPVELVQQMQEILDKETPEYWEKYPNSTAVGRARGFGFCPTDFWVPDWNDEYSQDWAPGSKYWTDGRDDRRVGDFGVYCGCVWGDDSSMKLRFIDLSRISEGIVTTDDRFGYVEIYRDRPLRECVEYIDDMDQFRVPVEIYFRRESGLARHWTKDEINWEPSE